MRAASLGRLTADPDRFAGEVWGRCPHLAERRGPFDDLFSLADADRFVAGALRPPAIRMVRGGSVIDAGAYCTTTRLGGQLVPQVVEPTKVADLVADGATLVLQSLHRHWAPLTGFADALTVELGHPVQVNAYLTPPGAAGLAAHADEHDVFAVQLHGTKRWWLDKLGDREMCPGDVLYVPAGWRHAARTDTAASLHLTIGVLRVTYRHVVERLLREHAEALDAPLPLGYRGGTDDSPVDRLTRGIREALDATIARLQGIDPRAVADAERGRAIRPYARTGHVASAVLGDAIDATTTIRWATVQPAFEALPPGADGRAWTRVRLGDRSLRVPTAARAAIAGLATAGERRVGELDGLDRASQLVVARRLVGEHACVIV